VESSRKNRGPSSRESDAEGKSLEEEGGGNLCIEKRGIMPENGSEKRTS